MSGTRGTCYIARVPGIGLAEAILEQAIRLARHMQLSTSQWCGTLCPSSACSYQVESPKKQQAACSRENIRSRLGLLSNLNFLQICAGGLLPASGQQQPVAQPARDRSRLSNPADQPSCLPGMSDFPSFLKPASNSVKVQASAGAPATSCHCTVCCSILRMDFNFRISISIPFL